MARLNARSTPPQNIPNEETNDDDSAAIINKSILSQKHQTPTKELRGKKRPLPTSTSASDRPGKLPRIPKRPRATHTISNRDDLYEMEKSPEAETPEATEQLVKRRRGRPRKIKDESPIQNGVFKVALPLQEPEVPIPSEEQNSEDQSTDEKAIRGSTRANNRRATKPIVALGEEEHDPDSQPEQTEETVPLPQQEGPGGDNIDTFIDPEVFADMLQTIGHVGYHLKGKNGKAKEWVRCADSDLFKSPKSILAQHIVRPLGILVKAYRNLQVANVHKAPSDVVKAEGMIAKIGPKFEKAASEMLSGLDDPQAHREDVEEMLTDMYFHVVPKLVECIKEAFITHASSGNIQDLQVQELIDLTSLSLRLVGSALARKFQPKDLKYQTVQPVKTVFTSLRNVKEKLRAEMRSRIEEAEEIQRQQRRENYATQQERRVVIEKVARQKHQERIAAEQEAEEERRQAKEDVERRSRNPRIANFMRRNVAELLPQPVWGSLLVEALDEADRKVPGPNPEKGWRETMPREVQERFEGGERVQIFEKHNNVKIQPAPWSKYEMRKLIKAMQWHRDEHDVFEKLASELDKSLEDVFANAKDFQESMDQVREQGGNVGPEHEWTKYIWPEVA